MPLTKHCLLLFHGLSISTELFRRLSLIQEPRDNWAELFLSLKKKKFFSQKQIKSKMPLQQLAIIIGLVALYAWARAKQFGCQYPHHCR